MRARGLVFRTALVACVLVSAAFSSVARGATGDLDPTFSGDGKQTTDMPLGSSRAAATAIQPDGKIVVVGRDFAHGGGSAVARYNPNGSPDPSFSGDGKLTNQVGDGAAVALQADGKIVVVGGVCRSAATTPMGRSTRASRAMAIRRSRTSPMQAVSRFRTTARSSWLAERLGRASPTTSASPATTPTARSTRASPETASRELILGERMRRRRWCFRTMARSWRREPMEPAAIRPRPLQHRRLARHELLRRRQGAECVRVSGGARGVALQSDGKIVVVGGTSGQIQARDFALVRYNTDGSLDTSFSGDGKQRTDIEDFDAATGVAVQGDGKIVAVGHADAWSITDVGQRLRPRPLQHRRLARHELLRRRQAGDRLLRHLLRLGGGGGAPGRRQDRRGWAGRPRWRRGLRARPLQPRRLAGRGLLRRR